MAIINASDSRISYIGNWSINDRTAIAKTDFCKAVIMLRGEKITVDAKGDILFSLDGSPDVSDKSFSTSDGLHTLFITAMKDAELISINDCEIVDIEKHLTEKMLCEYIEILTGRTVGDGSDFKRIPYKVEMPTENAQVYGFLGEIFERNVVRTKKCYTLPHFLIANDNSKKVISGWADWLTGSNYGRMLAGASKAYRFTRDKELLDIINNLVDRIENIMREDGFLNYYSEEKSYAINFIPGGENPRAVVADSERKNYDRSFWTLGLTEAAKAGNKKALSLVRRMYTWLEGSGYAKKLLLGLNSTNAVMGSLWLANSEIGRASDVIFNKKYLDQKCVEEAFTAKNPAAFSNFPGNRPHCYDLLVVLALSYEYRLTGEKHYLDALLGAWEVYRRYYKHTGGATAICESGGPYPPGSYYLEKGHNGETCGSVFWVWINEELSRLFPEDARYSEEIEEVLFNIAPSMFSGFNVRYHHRMQGKKEAGGSIGSCCEIMATHLSADLPKYACSYNRKEIYVNQLVSGKFKLGGATLKTDAKISDGAFSVTVERASSSEKTLRLRIPAWAKDARLYFNGKRIKDCFDGSYATLKRILKTGDMLKLSFSPECRAVRYTGAEQLESGAPRYAVLVGPYLMGLIGSDEAVPCLNVSPDELKVKKAGGSISIKVGEKMKFVPYCEIKNNENLCVFPAFNK